MFCFYAGNGIKHGLSIFSLYMSRKYLIHNSCATYMEGKLNHVNYRGNSNNDFKEKLILYINTIYANIYRCANIIHMDHLHVEIDQRKLRNFR